MMVPVHKFKNIYGCSPELDSVGMDITTRNAEEEGSHVQGPFGLHSMLKTCLGNYFRLTFKLKSKNGMRKWPMA